MIKPKLAIVGRPNVGKSALFNAICRKRIAIVNEEEGVTRDRLYAEVEYDGVAFHVIDTGGVDPHTTDRFKKYIRQQSEIAVEEADALLMVVDARTGPTDLDYGLAKMLLKTKKPLFLAVNKIDSISQEYLIHQFYGLGIASLQGISAIQGHHIETLLEKICHQGFPTKTLPLSPQKSLIKVAVMGRSNVGKSTLLNALLKESRCLVSEDWGTTRDSIDIPFTVGEDDYLLIDTAGIRKKQVEHSAVEKFAHIRSLKAMKRSDICLLVLDSAEGLTTQEKRLAREIEKSGKGCIILLNKWDLVKGYRMEHCLKILQKESPFLGHCPMIFLSAKTGKNLEKIFPEVKEVYQGLTTSLQTPQLNKFMEKVMHVNPPPRVGGKRLRIYYMTQVGHFPTQFLLFVNSKRLMTATYKRYLYNQLKSHYDFSGVPLKISLKGKTQTSHREEVAQE